MKPKKEWKSGLTREELTGKMREALEVIPGIGFGFSQPIQCRIDELVAGTRAQLILRLFGEDIEKLKSKADEMARVLSKIEGATDLLAEKVTGQPYLTIRDRQAENRALRIEHQRYSEHRRNRDCRQTRIQVLRREQELRHCRPSAGGKQKLG